MSEIGYFLRRDPGSGMRCAATGSGSSLGLLEDIALALLDVGVMAVTSSPVVSVSEPGAAGGCGSSWAPAMPDGAELRTGLSGDLKGRRGTLTDSP